MEPESTSPKGQGHHILWGGIEESSEDSHRNSTNGTDTSNSSNQNSQMPRRNIHKLQRRCINPQEIEFKKFDPSCSEATPSSSVDAHSIPPANAMEPGGTDRRRHHRHSAENDSGSSSLASTDDDSLRDMERQQQLQRQQMSQATASGENLQQFLGQVPLDDNGNPTSIGSIGHATGNCTVCIFVHTVPGCSNGISCTFCHFEHRRPRRKNKMRPCKGKRDRHLKFLTRLKGMIESDPHSFNMEEVELPPSIATNEVVKAKLLAKVQLHTEQVMAGLEGGLLDGVADTGGASSTAQPQPAPTVPPSSERRRRRCSLVSL